MLWRIQYDLFVFDFDGLLVDTERLHFAAYQRLCQKRGITLPWSLEEYCSIAHASSGTLRDALTRSYPQLLKDQEWETLYQEKKRHYLALLESEPVDLLPGVEELLEIIRREQLPSVVVTHSPAEQIILIRNQNPQLNAIPFWITREQYDQPKPNPDGYLKALASLKVHNTKAIGFEDSLRGFRSLQAAGITPVLINSPDNPAVAPLLQENIQHYASFKELLGRYF